MAVRDFSTFVEFRRQRSRFQLGCLTRFREGPLSVMPYGGGRQPLDQRMHRSQ